MSGCPNLVWALYRPGICPGARNVLVHMANVCDAARICRDPMAKIGRLFGMSVRTVMRYVRELEDEGYIKTEKRFRQANTYRVMVPDTESEKRANGPASYRADSDISTQPLNGDKHDATQPENGDKSRQSEPSGCDKTRQNARFNGDKNGTQESPIKNPLKEGGANAGLEGKEASKALDVAGLSAVEHSAASAWLRHVCGGSTARSDLVSRLATVRKYANPAYRWLRERVALAGEIAEAEGWYDAVEGRAPPSVAAPAPPPAADSRTPAEIAAAMSRQIAGKAHAPGGWVADRNTQIEQLSARRVKPAYLPRELLAARSMMARAAGVAVPA